VALLGLFNYIANDKHMISGKRARAREEGGKLEKPLSHLSAGGLTGLVGEASLGGSVGDVTSVQLASLMVMVAAGDARTMAREDGGAGLLMYGANGRLSSEERVAQVIQLPVTHNAPGSPGANNVFLSPLPDFSCGIPPFIGGIWRRVLLRLLPGAQPPRVEWGGGDRHSAVVFGLAVFEVFHIWSVPRSAADLPLDLNMTDSSTTPVIKGPNQTTSVGLYLVGYHLSYLSSMSGMEETLV